MIIKTGAKLEGKLACAFKNGMRNLVNFHQSTFENLKIGTLMGSFYPQQKMYELKIYSRAVSWQWRMMQNLKKNWLVTSKLTWEIWRILTQAIRNHKNLQFNGLLLTKVFNVWAKKSVEELCLMALYIDTKFEEKLTCTF